MTFDDLKVLIETPAFLFLMMLVGSVTSGLQQVATARRDGREVTCLAYLRYWPETLAVILGNIIAFVLLIPTDQLNLIAAIGIGFGMNPVVDSLRSGGRSVFLAEGKK